VGKRLAFGSPPGLYAGGTIQEPGEETRLGTPEVRGPGPRTAIRNEVIRLPELAVTEPIIKDADFDNCLILGPAVVVPLGVNFVSSTFEGDPEALFWEVPKNRQNVVGAIALLNCTFNKCRFSGVGIAGPRDALEQFREAVSQAAADNLAATPAAGAEASAPAPVVSSTSGE
jgi:hypothetical protein